MRAVKTSRRGWVVCPFGQIGERSINISHVRKNDGLGYGLPTNSLLCIGDSYTGGSLGSF